MTVGSQQEMMTLRNNRKITKSMTWQNEYDN